MPPSHCHLRSPTCTTDGDRCSPNVRLQTPGFIKCSQFPGSGLRICTHDLVSQMVNGRGWLGCFMASLLHNPNSTRAFFTQDWQTHCMHHRAENSLRLSVDISLEFLCYFMKTKKMCMPQRWWGNTPRCWSKNSLRLISKFSSKSLYFYGAWCSSTYIWSNNICLKVLFLQIVYTTAYKWPLDLGNKCLLHLHSLYCWSEFKHLF